jgi:purine-binding chemotaxis protein CheW
VFDEVSEVLYFNDKDIEDTPSFGTNLEINDILSMAKSKGGVKILLYIDRGLSVEEKNGIKN